MIQLRQLTWGVGFRRGGVAHGAQGEGVSTGVALFSAHGFQLVHHYRVFKQCAAHASLCGTFIIDLRYFTTRPCADTKRVAKRIRTSGTGSPTSPDSPITLPRGFTRGRSDDESPACKAPRAMSPVMLGESAQAATSTIVSVKKYCAPSVPKLRSASYGWKQPILPVSLPLPRFADGDFVLSPCSVIFGCDPAASSIPRIPGVHRLRQSG